MEISGENPAVQFEELEEDAERIARWRWMAMQTAVKSASRGLAEEACADVWCAASASARDASSPKGRWGKEEPATGGAGEDWDEEQRNSATRVHGEPAPK